MRLGRRFLGREPKGSEEENRLQRRVVELKSYNDDILRGLGQLLEALAHGYDEVLLVTSQARAERLDTKVFEASGIGLASLKAALNIPR
ncbi:MAG: hypothetical protein QXX94_07775 [Candidatus Bathyarchaeia archaeon]